MQLLWLSNFINHTPTAPAAERKKYVAHLCPVVHCKIWWNLMPWWWQLGTLLPWCLIVSSHCHVPSFGDLFPVTSSPFTELRAASLEDLTPCKSGKSGPRGQISLGMKGAHKHTCLCSREPFPLGNQADRKVKLWPKVVFAFHCTTPSAVAVM